MCSDASVTYRICFYRFVDLRLMRDYSRSEAHADFEVIRFLSEPRQCQANM